MNNPLTPPTTKPAHTPGPFEAYVCAPKERSYQTSDFYRAKISGADGKTIAYLPELGDESTNAELHANALLFANADQLLAASNAINTALVNSPDNWHAAMPKPVLLALLQLRSVIGEIEQWPLTEDLLEDRTDGGVVYFPGSDPRDEEVLGRGFNETLQPETTLELRQTISDITDAEVTQ